MYINIWRDFQICINVPLNQIGKDENDSTRDHFFLHRQSATKTNPKKNSPFIK